MLYFPILYLTLSLCWWGVVLWLRWECQKGTGKKRISFHRGLGLRVGNTHSDQITTSHNWKKRELESESLDMNLVATTYLWDQTSAPSPVRWGDSENQIRAYEWNEAYYKHICLYIHCIEESLGMEVHRLNYSSNPATTSPCDFGPFTPFSKPVPLLWNAANLTPLRF